MTPRKTAFLVSVLVAMPAYGQGTPQVTVDAEGKKSIVIHGDPAAAKAYREGIERSQRRAEDAEAKRRLETHQGSSQSSSYAARIEAERHRQVHIGYECVGGDEAYFSVAPCPRTTTVTGAISGFDINGTLTMGVPVHQTKVISTVGCEEGKAAAARAVTFVERDRAAAFMARYCK